MTSDLQMIDVDFTKPNMALDALVAEKVLGLNTYVKHGVPCQGEENPFVGEDLHRYSHDISVQRRQFWAWLRGAVREWKGVVLNMAAESIQLLWCRKDR